MTTIERKDLVHAVLASRDEIDPDLETELLEAIVDAEATAAGDGEVAMRAIDAAVTAAIERGINHQDRAQEAAGDVSDAEKDEDEA